MDGQDDAVTDGRASLASRRSILSLFATGVINGLQRSLDANSARANRRRDKKKRCRGKRKCRRRSCCDAGNGRTASPPGASPDPTGNTTPPNAGFRIIAEYPHDSRAFTQGLAYVAGVLYEGTGLYGQSTLRRVDLGTGQVLQRVELDAMYFGEGISVVGDRIYQLTWREQTVILYDRATLESLGTLSYPTEGWGLTSDGNRLIMSDGSSRLLFRNPSTFAEVGSVDVRDGDVAVANLNELEYIQGEIWANVWQTERIARIDPATGKVRGWVDLTGLLSDEDRAGHVVDVLNGIAHDPATGRLFVTGKLWPKLFEIEVVPA